MSLSREDVRQTIIAVLKGMTQDWDLEFGEMGPHTRLSADLCFTSVDMLNLMATLDVQFRRRLPYEQLIMREGRYRDELTVAELAEFVVAHPVAEKPGPTAM